MITKLYELIAANLNRHKVSAPIVFGVSQSTRLIVVHCKYLTYFFPYRRIAQSEQIGEIYLILILFCYHHFCRFTNFTMQRYLAPVSKVGTANNYFQNIMNFLRFRSVSEPPSTYFLS